MKQSQIIATLRAIKAIPAEDRRSLLAIGLNTVATEANISIGTVHRILHVGRMSWQTHCKLSAAFKRLFAVMEDHAPLALRLAAGCPEQAQLPPPTAPTVTKTVRFR